MIRNTSDKLLAIFALAVLLAPIVTYAQTDTLSEGSLAISPFLIDTQIQPGQSQEHTITVFNVTNSPLPITVSINDFVPSGEHGSVRFLDTGQQSHSSFSLASWITITRQPEFVVEPQGQTTIALTLRVPVDAEPGTHYGGLLFSTRDTAASTANTTVVRKVGALLLVATGKTDPAGNIQHFTSDKQWYTTPAVAFASTFVNTGNVHLSPKGQVEIRNMFGRLIGESYMNENAQFVLPHNSRVFEGVFQKPWLFGRYSAKLTFWYGNPKLEAQKIIHFWVIPVGAMVWYGGLGIAALLLGYFSLKRYNKWVIHKGTRNKRIL